MPIKRGDSKSGGCDKHKTDIQHYQDLNNEIERKTRQVFDLVDKLNDSDGKVGCLPYYIVMPFSLRENKQKLHRVDKFIWFFVFLPIVRYLRHLINNFHRCGSWRIENLPHVANIQ